MGHFPPTPLQRESEAPKERKRERGEREKNIILIKRMSGAPKKQEDKGEKKNFKENE